MAKAVNAENPGQLSRTCVAQGPTVWQVGIGKIVRVV